MGGVVAMSIKKPSGEMVNMLCWTNILPRVLSDPELFSDDPSSVVDALVSTYDKLRADYHKHKDDRRFEYGSTELYFPWDEVAPCEYGLIYIDLQQKIILNMQDYCLEPMGMNMTSAIIDVERKRNILAMLNNGMISRIKIDHDIFKVDATKDMYALLNHLIESSKKQYVAFEISPPGFTITNFEKNNTGTAELFSALSRMGALDLARDLPRWHEYLEGRDYDNQFLHRAAESLAHPQ